MSAPTEKLKQLFNNNNSILDPSLNNNNNNNNNDNFEEKLGLKYNNLTIEIKERVFVIKLNRPQVKNAFDRMTGYEMIRALSVASNDPNISIIVLTGSGDCFSSGNDLRQIEKYDDKDVYYRTANYVLKALVSAFIHCKKVIVTIVNGPAIGFGFTICGLCDIVYCTQNSYFEAPFTEAGLCPEACASVIFPQIMGRSKASEVLLLGHRMSSQEAYHFNFVSQVFRDQNDLDQILWPKLLENSKLSINILQKNKRLLLEHLHDPLAKALDLEIKTLGVMRRSETNRKYVEAFFNRRKSIPSKL